MNPLFLLALDRQPELITEALKNNIMLVSPTTLLVALRTIANLWRYEHQSRNAQQIADRASKLYDKMRLFIDDMSAIGQSLDKAQDNYRRAMKKTLFRSRKCAGAGRSVSRFRVEIKREINPDLAEQAVSQMKSIDFGRFRSSRMMKLINAMMNIISSRASPLGVVKPVEI